MAGYEATWRTSLAPFFKPACAYNFILIGIRYMTSGTKMFHWYFLYGSMSFSLLLITIAVEFRRKLTDYIHAWIIFIRIAATFLLMHLVTTGTGGFENTDLKELCQTIDYIALPYLVLMFVNWKFNLFVTAPVTVVSCYVATKMSLTPSDGNMACFLDHETFSNGIA